jgi:putative ABC transport system permease protein
VTKLFLRLGLVFSDALLSLLTLAAWVLSPLRLGRLLRTISIPRMREHKARSTMTIMGVALGVAVLVAVHIVSDSVIAGVSATVDNIAGKADLQLSTASSGFDEALLDRIHATPGVYKATPVVQQPATILNEGARGDRLLMLGVDLLGTEDAYFRDYASHELSAIRKDALEFLNSTSNVLISRQVAERLHLKLHDKLKLSTDHGAEDFDVWGFIDGDGIGRAFGGAIAVMYYPSMQVAFGRGNHIDHVDVAVTPGTDPAEVENRLHDVLGAGFNIDRPATRGQRVQNMLAALRSSLSLASSMALAAGGMLVFNTMAITLVQRRRELATLQALGTTRFQVVQLFTLEGMLIGLVGSAAGVALGVAMSRLLLELCGRAISRVYIQQALTDVHIRWQALALGFGMGIFSTTMASAIPSMRAAKVKVAESLRSGAITSLTSKSKPGTADAVAVLMLVAAYFLMQIPPHGTQPVGAFAAAGAVLVAGRLFLPRVIQLLHAILSPIFTRIFGLDARLANDNLPRDIGRTAATTTALMAGAALTVGFSAFNVSFISSLNEWSEQSVPGDLFVTSGAGISGLSSRNIPMEPDLGYELDKLPEVEVVQRLRLADYDYKGFPVKLISSEWKIAEHYSQRTYLEGGEEDSRKMQDGKVTVSENFAHRFNVHRGDVIQLSGKDGAIPFEVSAVIIDYSSDIGTIRFDRAIYQKFWDDNRVDTFEVHLHPGNDVEAVRRTINERFGAKYDLFVLTNKEFRGEMLDAADSIFTIMRVLEFVLLVVAALGILNSLLANVLDRIREIGVLRALGMLRGQVARMIVMEAMLIGLVGIVAGALTGIGMGYVILTHVMSVQTGWYFTYQVPIRRIAEIAAVALPIAAFAGWYPARQAAGLVVRDALDYE